MRFNAYKELMGIDVPDLCEYDELIWYNCENTHGDIIGSYAEIYDLYVGVLIHLELLPETFYDVDGTCTNLMNQYTEDDLLKMLMENGIILVIHD